MVHLARMYVNTSPMDVRNGKRVSRWCGGVAALRCRQYENDSTGTSDSAGVEIRPRRVLNVDHAHMLLSKSYDHD